MSKYVSSENMLFLMSKMDEMLIIWREHACFRWSRNMANGGPEKVMPWLCSHREHGQHPVGLDSWVWLALSLFSGGLSIFRYVIHIEVFPSLHTQGESIGEVSWISCGGSGLGVKSVLQVLVSISLNLPGSVPVLGKNVI